jgi:hypothetical protein
MKKILPVLLLAMLVFNSCEDEDIRTVTVTYETNVSLPANSRWVFISDGNGNSIDYASLPDNGTVVLRIPGSFKEETVTLNYFTTGGIAMSSQDLTSFTGITPGNYTISTKRSVPGSSLSSAYAKLNLTNTADDVDFTFGGQAFNMGFFEGVFTLNIFPDLNGEAKTLVSGFDKLTNEGRYNLFSVKANEQLMLDFNNFSEFEKSEIGLTGDFCHVSQYAYAGDVEYMIRGKDFVLSTETPTSIPLYHAQSFHSYLTSIRVYQGADSYSNVVDGTQIPTTFVKLDADVQVKANDQAGVEFNFTGQADVAQIAFTHEISNRWGPNTVNTRTYYLPAAGSVSFRHPMIPAQILDAIGIEEYQVGLLDRISLVDYVTLGGYDDLLHYRFQDNQNFLQEVKSGAKWRTIGF